MKKRDARGIRPAPDRRGHAWLAGLVVVVLTAAVYFMQRGSGHAAVQAGEIVDDGRPRRALLVGIADYHDRTQHTRDGRIVLPPLQGAENDLELFTATLRGLGFQARDMRTLRGAQATVENVVCAFAEHLIQGVTKETEVVFVFSGHGSRVKDRSGHEAGGMDSSLVLYDSRVEGSELRDLDDDALHSLLAACPSERITVITDCCNSGNVTRGGDVGDVEVDGVRFETLGVREAEFADQPTNPETWPFWPAGVPFLEDGAAGRRVPLPWVHVAACASHEVAHEMRVSPRGAPARARVFGAMGYHLCQELLRAGRPWDAIANGLREKVRRVVPAQHPQLEGPGRRLAFADGTASRLFGYSARPMQDGRLALEGGAYAGLVVGATCHVVRLTDRARMGRCVITEVDVGSSFARWDPAPPAELAVDAVLSAVPATPGDPRQALRVARSTTTLLALEMRPKLCASPWLLVIDDEEDVYRFASREGRVELLAPDGYRVWPRATGLATIDGLTRDARREVDFQSLWRLGDRGRRGGIDVVARILPASSTQCEELASAADDKGLDRFVPAVLKAKAATPPVIALSLPSEADQRRVKVGQLVMYEFGVTRGPHFVLALELEQATRRASPLSSNDGWAGEEVSLRSRATWLFAPSEADWPAPVSRSRVLVLASDRAFDLSSMLPDDDRPRGGARDVLDGIDPQDWGVAAVDVVVTRGK